APSREMPVIIISIDTLRSDHLPVYGYRGVGTPNIDRLRAGSILFEHAYSHIPLTLPSHATIFTGRVPAASGVRDNLGFRLGPAVPTLAEALKSNGYATGAAVSAFVLRKESGIGRGFDFYEDQIDAENPGANIGRVQRSGYETAGIAEKWIAAHDRRPFFFFLHLYEPHTPYDPPEPFRSRYPSRYDGEIATADDIVGKFIAFLQREGIYDKALIILLSDHGEGLNDHGELEHGLLLYREALQVPLIVKLPRQSLSGRSVSDPVQLSDVFPTVTTLTGSKSAAVAGTSLLAIATTSNPPRQIYAETLYPKLHYGWSDLHSLIDRTKHYIHGPKPELYDMAADAAEKHNILGSDRRTVAAMRSAILPLIDANAAPSAVSPEEAKKLAALGYIGSAIAPASGPLADPKEKVGVTDDLRKVFSLYERAKYAEALPLLQKLVHDNDRMLDVWDMLARDLDQLGRTDEAIDAAKQALRLSPTTTHLALMVATMSLDIGRLDDAEKHASLALEAEPGLAHDVLARVALARGDLPRAEKEAHLALETRDRLFALLTLGNIEHERKNYSAALTWCDKAIEVLQRRKGTSVKGLYFLKGDTLARLGRNDEAEVALRKEIELFPRDPRAYQNLVLLYAAEGKSQDATQLVFDLEKNAHTAAAYAAIASTLRTLGDKEGVRFWIARGLQQFPQDAKLRKLATGASG
ncbi:MAG TPA: sulfatase-like hydrolase/transferase, partial [Thermoanaerobaculia bacterium]|nr:sulfatase-like hydrolase/transferase [Thermoanaerobaculia bacterium]